MSIFNDKALKGVADAVSKIMDEELKGNQHKIDANKNGKVDAHDFKLLRAKKGMKEEAEKMAKKDHDGDGKVESGKAEYLGSRIRAAKAAGKMKEEVEITEGFDDHKKIAAELVKRHGKNVNKQHIKDLEDERDSRRPLDHSEVMKHVKQMHKESVQLDEAFPTVADAKKRMDAGKTSTGTVTKTKTGLVHKRDYKDDDNDADDTQKKSKGYGARQNFKRSTRVNEQKLSFTEMLHLYKESGVEVINKIAPQTVKFGDTEVELIDANIVNGAVGITVAEEVDNETFTKEVEAQKEKNAGRGKKAEVAKASVQAVKQEEVEQIDEISKELAGKYLTAPQGKGANKYKTGEGKSSYPNYDAMSKHDKSLKRALQRAGTGMSKKPSYYKEEEQLDELSKSTLGSYIKKAQSKQINDYQDQADNSGYGEHPERRKGLGRSQNIHRAVDKLASKKTNEETEQINEISKKTLGSYIKAASHDVAAKGAFTRHFADKSRAETAAQRPDLARKSMKQADKVQDAGMKRRANMAKAVDRLTKEDVEQIDERTLTSGETAKKEDYVKGMKKSVSGFKARYGDKAKSVMYATATSMAKKKS